MASGFVSKGLVCGTQPLCPTNTPPEGDSQCPSTFSIGRAGVKDEARGILRPYAQSSFLMLLRSVTSSVRLPRLHQGRSLWTTAASGLGSSSSQVRRKANVCRAVHAFKNFALTTTPLVEMNSHSTNNDTETWGGLANPKSHGS